jgi:hypothetical protein
MTNQSEETGLPAVRCIAWLGDLVVALLIIKVRIEIDPWHLHRHDNGGSRLKVELIELPFANERRFWVRVNRQWAPKVPVASKTIVTRQVRSWLVKH